MDLALHLNGVRAAVSGKYTEAENWKQPGALAGMVLESQPANTSACTRCPLQLLLLWH